MSDSKTTSDNALTTIENPTFLTVLSKAVESDNVDPAKLQTLLDVQIRVMDKQAEMEFNAAMAKLQKVLPTVKKNGKIEFTDKNGVKRETPFAKYEDIDKAIRPHMLENGFTMSYSTAWLPDGGCTMTGTLAHVGGHQKQSTIRLPLDTSGSKNNLQAAGSTISYGKRYLTGMLLNIITVGEDDDGQGADEVITAEQHKEILDLIVKAKADAPKFCKTYKIEKPEELKAKDFAPAKALLEAKIKQNEKKAKDKFHEE